MEKLGLGLDDSGASNEDRQQQSAEEARRLSMQRCLQALVHACQCRDANCHLQSCQKMKRIVLHSKSCKRKNNGCPACRQLLGLCCHHAKICQEARCLVPFCISIRQKLQQKQLQQRLLQAQLMRRRMMAMQMSSQAASAAQPGPVLSGAIAPSAGAMTASGFGVGSMSAPEVASKPVGTPPDASLRWPGMQSPSAAAAAGSSASSAPSSHGGLLDGSMAMMSPQHQQSSMTASPKQQQQQQASVMMMDQQSDWKLPQQSPGAIANDVLKPSMNMPSSGLAFGQQQQQQQQPPATSTAAVAIGQLRLPTPSSVANKTSISSERLSQLLKSKMESGVIDSQQFLALIRAPIPDAIKQVRLTTVVS